MEFLGGWREISFLVASSSGGEVPDIPDCMLDLE